MKSKYSIIEEIKNEKNKDKFDLLCDRYLNEVNDDKLKGEIFFLKGFNSHYSDRTSDENFYMVINCYENALKLGYNNYQVYGYLGLIYLSPEYNGYNPKFCNLEKACYYYKINAEIRRDCYGYEQYAKTVVHFDPKEAIKMAELTLKKEIEEKGTKDPNITLNMMIVIAESMVKLQKYKEALEVLKLQEKDGLNDLMQSPHSWQHKLYEGFYINIQLVKAQALIGLGENKSVRDTLDNLREFYTTHEKTLGNNCVHFQTSSKLKELFKRAEEVEKQLNSVYEDLKQKVGNSKELSEAYEIIKNSASKAIIENAIDKKAPVINQENIIKQLVADNQDMKAQNQFLMDMIMQLNARLEKVEKNEQKLYCVTEVVYDNDLLNHPELLKLSIKEFGISRVLDMSNSLSSELISEAIGQNNAELLLAGCISLDCSDII